MKRQALYDQANQFIHDNVPAVPMVHNSTAIAFRKEVQGVQPSPFNQELFGPVSVQGKDNLIFARGGELGGGTGSSRRDRFRIADGHGADP